VAFPQALGHAPPQDVVGAVRQGGAAAGPRLASPQLTRERGERVHVAAGRGRVAAEPLRRDMVREQRGRRPRRRQRSEPDVRGC
jgi:hypothetical protein